MVVVVTVFGSLVGTTRLVKDANACSCWCFPVLGNILPFSLGRDEVRCKWLSSMVIKAVKPLSLVEDTYSCSHTSLNFLPLYFLQESAEYLWHVRKLLSAYAAMLFVNFLVVFIVMAGLYCLILKEFRSISSRVGELKNETVIKGAVIEGALGPQ